MATVIGGALLGWAFSGSLVAAHLVTTVWGAVMLGASLGSLFVNVTNDFGDYSSSPNYSFGAVSNTMSQLLPIPVIYGGPIRVAGNIIYQAFEDDTKEKQTLYVLIGEGPVQSISSVLCNDQNPDALDDCSVSVYLNTDASTRDSRDPSGTRPYPNDVAIICMSLKAQEKLSGTPTVTSIVEGVKVWTPNGFLFSRNPVWCVLDILCHPRYGLGYCIKDANGNYSHPDWDKIDYDCAVAAANYCDAAQSDGKPLFAFDFVFDTRTTVRDALTTMLSVCRGYLIQTDKLEIHIDAPVSAYAGTIDAAHIVKDSFTTWQATDQDVYNRLSVEWINPDDSYERTSDVFEDSTDIADRGVVEKTISLLGITNDRQVGQMGYYLLSTSLNVQNFCSFSVGFKDISILPGEVYNINFPKLGWNNRPARVINVQSSEGSDTMQITCSEYVEACYNGTAYSLTQHISTQVTKNYTQPDCTDMTLSETLEVSQDGGYIAKVKAVWTPPQTCGGLTLWYRYQNDATWTPLGDLPRNATEYYIDVSAHIGDTIYVKIFAISSIGVSSAGLVASKRIGGDETPPALPTNLSAAGNFRMATVKWSDPADADLDHINIYRCLDSYAGAYVKIGSARRGAQEYIDSNLGVFETVWYKATAVDVAGNESAQTAYINCITKAIEAADIPDATITESKLSSELSTPISKIPTLASDTDNLKDNADANADSVIEGLLNHSEEETNNSKAVVFAKRDLTTLINSGISAEAAERLLLYARMGNAEASIEENASAIANVDGTVKAQYVLKLNANGKVAGMGLVNDGNVSELAILADVFTVSDGNANYPVFEIGTDSNGNKFLAFTGNLFVKSAGNAGTGWIKGDMISASSQIQIGSDIILDGINNVIQIGQTIVIDGGTGSFF